MGIVIFKKKLLKLYSLGLCFHCSQVDQCVQNCTSKGLYDKAVILLFCLVSIVMKDLNVSLQENYGHHTSTRTIKRLSWIFSQSG